MKKDSLPSSDESRREEILEAALHCFLHFGYAKTSMDDVAKKAKISRPLIYLKFKNKEALYLAIWDHLLIGRLKEAEEFAKKNLPKKEKLFGLYDIFLIFCWEKISGFPMSQEFFSTCDDICEESSNQYHKHLLKLTTSVLGDKELAEVMVFAVYGQMEDIPTVKVLRRRLEILIDKFAR